jgi:CheY-like chemotaxis protein
MGKKILLADDSLTIQKVVELTLSATDYELTCVSNGQRALEQVSHARPDLILADVVMPEKNGYEVCEAVKSNPATARIPLVLLSGTFEPFDRERAERIGCDLVISKPFDAQQLLEQIETLLSREAETPSAPPPPDEAPFTTAFLDDTGQAAPESAVVDFESPFHPDYEGVPAAPGTAAASEAASEAAPLHAVAAETGLAIQEPLPPIPEPPAEAPAAPPPAAPIELAIEEISAEDAEILFDRAAPEQAGSAPPEPLPAGQLTEEQIERIATRVVEKLSDRVVREIAWEVVPDVAEIAVKRRIEELESGAE